MRSNPADVTFYRLGDPPAWVWRRPRHVVGAYALADHAMGVMLFHPIVYFCLAPSDAYCAH